MDLLATGGRNQTSDDAPAVPKDDSETPRRADARAAFGDKACILHGVWQSVLRGRMAPRRADITLSMVGKLSAWMWAVHIEGADFRFRLIGDGIVRLLGRNDTGKPLSQVAESDLAQGLRRICHAGRAQRRPQRLGPDGFLLSHGTPCRLEVLALPLSEDNVSISGLIGTLERFEAPHE